MIPNPNPNSNPNPDPTCCKATKPMKVKVLVTQSCPTLYIVVVQSLTCVQLFVIPWTAAPQTSLSFTVSQSLFKLMSIELVMPSKHLILCHLLSSCPQSFQHQGLFQRVSSLHQVAITDVPISVNKLVNAQRDWG